MSSTNNLKSAAVDMMFCACCGIAEGDDIKLRTCTACKSARYCSVKCQKEHRSKHKRECKNRAAELRDELLFKQPESSHWGDCPICCLPQPIGAEYSTLMPCCSKIVCDGCVYANMIREHKQKLQIKCPFCRHPLPETKEETDMQIMKRAQANDPVAIGLIALKRNDEGNYEGAVEYYTKAAELGDIASHYVLSTMYQGGVCGEKNKKMEVYHLEEAAIGGHPTARHNLGVSEAENGNYERAIRHLIIAASLGYEPSIEMLKANHARGHVSKEDFAVALRAHQAALDATKSPQREAAEKWEKQQK